MKVHVEDAPTMTDVEVCGVEKNRNYFFNL